MIAVVILLLLYIFSDLNYYLRCIFSLGYAFLFEKRRNFSDKTTIHGKRISFHSNVQIFILFLLGICTTQDVDINNFNHMNNARYLREIDFASFHYYVVTGLHDKIKKHGGATFKSASKIRYRRLIPIFTQYKVETQMIWWNNENIFFQQKFITSDGFVRAVVMSKTRVLNVDIVQLLKEYPGGENIPPKSKELKLWLEADEESSETLRGSA